jgi:uncharacterized protein (DUF1778 family)
MAKTAILIYCTPEEREQIQRAAKRERRTITGFVMNAVTNRFAIEGRIQDRKMQAQATDEKRLTGTKDHRSSTDSGNEGV